MRGGQDFPTPDVPASKLFLLLATGQTARFALTGKESALEAALTAPTGPLGRRPRSSSARATS